MSETLAMRDPFTGKDVEISNRLTDRLRGRYACGPMLPNGEPEFGWRDHEVPPIQKEAAQVIENLRFDLEHTLRAVLYFFGPEGAEKVTSHVMAARNPASHD